MTATEAVARVTAPQPQPESAGRLRAVYVVVWLLCLSLFIVAQYGRLGYPLFWQDEAETAMFGRRILDHGHPKVHGDEGVVFGMNVPMAAAVDADRDAYTGSLWGQYYVAALGVALSDLATDDHARTALVRLPFALAGTAGLWLFWLSVAPVVGDGRRRLVMAAAYWLAMSSSVSLLLHLREARYYALVVFFVGAIVFLRGREPGAWRSLGVGLCLFALFNVFYPAAAAVGAWWVLEAVLPLARADGRTPEGGRAALAECAPVAVVAVLVVPIVMAFRMVALGELMSARYQFGVGDYLTNLVVLVRHLAAHELLIGALLLRVAAWQVGRRAPGPAAALPFWRLVLVWALFGARNPIFFERYFVALGPVLVIAALLDVARLQRSFERSVPEAAQRTRMLAAVVGVVVLGSVVLKAPELVGRARELWTPVEGPLDVAVPWVRERWDGSAPPTVATNYEAEVWMFYLGAPVVGRFHDEGGAAARAEAATRVDFVVPRKGYPHTVERVRRFIEPGRFERFALDVADLPYNTIPELSAGRVLTVTHPFETRRPEHPGAALEIWERRETEASP